MTLPDHLSRKRKAWLALLEATLAVVFWGGSFIATKIALRELPPVTVVWLRFAMGVVILGITLALRGRFSFPRRKDLGYFSLLGFLGITFHQWLQSNGLVTSQATTTAWIVATTPIFMALLGWLVLKEKLSWLQVLGILAATIGVLSVVTKGDFGSLFVGQFGEKGDLLILISAINWAVFSALSRRGLKTYPATWMMFYVMGLGWLFTTFLFLYGPGFTSLHSLSEDAWRSIAFLGIACSGLAYIFWFDALQHLPVAQAGAFLYLEPVVTVIVAALFLQEQILLATMLGGGLILLGVWLVNKFTTR